MKNKSLQENLIKLVQLVEESLVDGHGEVNLRVVIASKQITMIHLSKTQSIKVQP